MLSNILLAISFHASATPAVGVNWSEATRFTLLQLAIESDRVKSLDAAYASLLAPQHIPKLFEVLRAKLENAPNNAQLSIMQKMWHFPERKRFVTRPLCSIATNAKSSESNRVAAMQLLATCGVSDRTVMDALYRCLNEKPPDPNALPKPPGVILILGPGENAQIRCAAAIAIWNLEKQTAAIAPHLFSLLESQRSRDKVTAIEAIATIGMDLKPVLGSRIVEMLGSDDQEVREAAMKLLPVFAPSRAVAATLLSKNLLRSGQAYSRLCEDFHSGRTRMTLDQFADVSGWMSNEPALAKRLLAGLGSDALPEISKLLQSKSAIQRSAGLNTLRMMRHVGQMAESLKAIPEIEQLLTDPDAEVKELAEAALKELRRKP